MKAGIYKLTINDTFYYGQTQDLDQREKQHAYNLRELRHHNRHLQRAYDKYGDLTFEVVLRCETTDLNRYEQWFLDTYHSMEKCANMAKDVESPMRGRPMTEEAKDKISKANIGKVRGPMADETKAKLRAAHLGRVIPEETRNKISATLTGRKGKAHTPESKAKLRQANLGRKHTEETRRKMREYDRSNRDVAAIGLKAAETRTAGYRYVVERSTGSESYRTLKSCAEALSVSEATVCRWTKGSKPSAKQAIISVKKKPRRD